MFGVSLVLFFGIFFCYVLLRYFVVLIFVYSFDLIMES